MDGDAHDYAHDDALAELRQWVYADGVDDSTRTAALTELVPVAGNFFEDAWDGDRFVACPDWAAAQLLLEQHDAEHTRQCAFCLRIFNRDAYASHDCTKRPRVCKKCGRVFATKKLRRQHLCRPEGAPEDAPDDAAPAAAPEEVAASRPAAEPAVLNGFQQWGRELWGDD